MFTLRAAGVREQVTGRFQRMSEELLPRFHGSSRFSSIAEGFAGMGNQPFPFLQSALFSLFTSLDLIIQITVDPSLLAYRSVIEGIGRPDGEIRIFSDFEGANPFVDAQLLGGVEGDEFESLRLGQVAVLDRLGRFQVHAAGMVRGVRVEAYDASAFVHESPRVGDGVIDFELVGPPVGKGRGTRSMAGDLVRYLVAFQNVLEATDSDSEAFHGA